MRELHRQRKNLLVIEPKDGDAEVKNPFPRFADDEEPSQILPVLILIIGFSCLAFGAFEIYQVKKFRQGAAHVSGQISALEEKIDPDGRPSKFIPTIEFKTEKNVSVRAKISSSPRPQGFYKIGGEVNLLYDPKSPKQKISIVSPGIAVIRLSVFIVPGIGFCMILIGLAFFRRRNGFG
jgi:hypothetical protein